MHNVHETCTACGGVGLVASHTNTHKNCARCGGHGSVEVEAKRKDNELTMDNIVWATTYAQAFSFLKIKDANCSKPDSAHGAIASRVADEAVAEFRKRMPKIG